MSDTLKPRSNLEQILNGDKVTPKNRLAYFVKKAIDRIIGSSGGGENDEIVITATVNPVTKEISNASMTLDDVVAAAKEVKRLVFRIAVEIDGVIYSYTTFPAMDITEFIDNGETVKTAIFSHQTMDDGRLETFIIAAVSGDHDGAWTFHEIPASGSDFVVTFTATMLDGRVTMLTADKQISEIIEARTAGKRVIGRISDPYEQEFMFTMLNDDNEGDLYVGFMAAFPDAGTQKTKLCSVLGHATLIEGAENDEWSYYGD